MIKLPATITSLLMQLRAEIMKNYRYEDIPDAVYSSVIFLIRGFSPRTDSTSNNNLQTLIVDKLLEKFSWRK